MVESNELLKLIAEDVQVLNEKVDKLLSQPSSGGGGGGSEATLYPDEPCLTCGKPSKWFKSKTKFKPDGTAKSYKTCSVGGPKCGFPEPTWKK